jgi:hypothetical protein
VDASPQLMGQSLGRHTTFGNMKDYDTRVLRSAMTNLSTEDYFWRLMEPAWTDEGRGTPGQQALARVTYFLRDAENGGLHQALWNRSSDQVAAVVADFARLGADQQAALVRTAERLLLGSTSPVDLSIRRERIDARASGWSWEALEQLDAQLADEPTLWPLFHRYVDAHPEEFFRP